MVGWSINRCISGGCVLADILSLESLCMAHFFVLTVVTDMCALLQFIPLAKRLADTLFPVEGNAVSVIVIVVVLDQTLHLMSSSHPCHRQGDHNEETTIGTRKKLHGTVDTN